MPRQPVTGPALGDAPPGVNNPLEGNILTCSVTMPDALSLVDQPQLLQPNARRSELFGILWQPVTGPASGDAPPGVNNPPEGNILSCLVTMPDVLLLVDQPQLLQPNARREELFGMPRHPVTVPPPR
ncbi:unnamed protein product [Chilo suppressalis]|uniref:Uncharacterized protein n=1 Tax=Chilo suppressalis TaxID=168631 RepID=A0ABN8ASJ7_CHISP|nr:unnamed protein product [Chilo suppressalis]